MDVGNVIWSLVLLVVGAVLGVLLTEVPKRPKLRINGGSAGGLGDGFGGCSLTITNERGFFGIPLGRTILFGRPLWRSRRLGVNTKRHTAEVRASIHRADDPAAGGASLYFFDPANPAPTDLARIPDGGTASLRIFAWQPGVSRQYFIFQPDVGGSPRVPQDGAKYEGPRNFVVRLYPVDGGRMIETPVSVVVDFGGHLQFQSANGSMLMME